MLAISVRVPLVLATLGTLGGIAALLAPHPVRAEAPPLAVASGEADDVLHADPLPPAESGPVALSGDALEMLLSLERPPVEPWAPVGCNADASDVVLDARVFVIDGVGYVQTIETVGQIATACMHERIGGRIARLRALELPMAGLGNRQVFHVGLRIHAQDPDTFDGIVRE